MEHFESLVFCEFYLCTTGTLLLHSTKQFFFLHILEFLHQHEDRYVRIFLFKQARILFESLLWSWTIVGFEQQIQVFFNDFLFEKHLFQQLSSHLMAAGY